MANAFTQTPTGKKITIAKRKADLQKTYSVGPDHVMVFEDGEKILIEDGANLLVGDEELVVEFADQAVPGRELFGQAERVAQANVGDALRAGITEINTIPVTLTSAAVGLVPVAPLGIFGGAVGVAAVVDKATTGTPETTPVNSVLAQIGTEGDNPDITNSVVTAAQLSSIIGVSGVDAANEAAYRDYIDANPDLFGNPATLAEVNAMIATVNALVDIGAEADDTTTETTVTFAQLNTISGISGALEENEAAYLAYIDANPDAFSAPATVAEVNAMIKVVNALEKIRLYAENNGGTVPVATDYSDIGVMGLGDGATAPSVAQVNSVLVSTAVVGSEVDTAAEVKNVVDAYKRLLDLANGADDSDVKLTNTDVTALGWDGVVTNAADVETLSLLTDAFDHTASSKVANHSDITSIAQTVANIILAAQGATVDLTQADFEAIGVKGLTDGQRQDLLSKIAASMDDGSDVDTVAELKAMVDATAPTLSITDNVTAAVATGPITYTFNFSEDVGTSFTFDDITVSGDAVVSNFTQVNATTYTAIVTPRGTDTLSVSVAAGEFTDLAGNANGSLMEADDQDYSVIMMGGFGRLIHGVQVEGNWYYAYDRNGDGVHNDLYSMSNLEKIFYGTAAGVVITEDKRETMIDGVTLRLPTDGRTGAFLGTATFVAGTAVDDPSQDNSTYSDLAAIWDAFNGSSTGTGGAGVPLGWASGIYWSATPSSASAANSHGRFNLTNGYVNNNDDALTNYVVFQVIL